MNINGRITNDAAVRYLLMPNRIMNAPTILIKDITIFSGP